MHNENATIEALMKRGDLYLEDHDWENAKKYFNDSLDIDPENSKAYIGMLLSELHIEKENDLVTSEISFTDNYHYQKALRFAEEEYLQQLQSYNLENSYFRANKILSTASNESTKIADIVQAKKLLYSLNGYKNSDELATECDAIIEQLYQKKAAMKRKLTITISLVVAIAFVSLITGLLVKSSANAKIAEEIYQNFLGQDFSGKNENDYGFYSDYTSNSLNEYMTYWLDTDRATLDFNEDGSVYYTKESDMTALAWPSLISKPEGTHFEYDGTYDSFNVRVAMNGDVYLELGISSYLVEVYDDNVPTAISYDGIRLS